MRDKKLVLAFTLFMGFLFLFPMPVAADPPGYTGDSGSVSPGGYYAYTKSYESDVWDYVSVSESYGDYYLHGDSDSGYYVIEYFCLIKIKPSTSTKDHVQIKITSEFKYGISAGWGFWNYAQWYIQYVVIDMSETARHPIGWSSYTASDGISGGSKNNQDYDTPGAYYSLYDTLRYQNYEVIDTSDWNYVGIWIKCVLSNDALFYRYSSGSGNAWYNPTKIYWNFFSD